MDGICVVKLSLKTRNIWNRRASLTGRFARHLTWSSESAVLVCGDVERGIFSWIGSNSSTLNVYRHSNHFKWINLKVCQLNHKLECMLGLEKVATLTVLSLIPVCILETTSKNDFYGDCWWKCTESYFYPTQLELSCMKRIWNGTRQNRKIMERIDMRLPI